MVAPEGVASERGRGNQKGAGASQRIDDARPFNRAVADEALGKGKGFLPRVIAVS
jgi:hypothetical protein